MVKKVVSIILTACLSVSSSLSWAGTLELSRVATPELRGIKFTNGSAELLYKGFQPKEEDIKRDLQLFLTGIAFPLEEIVVDLNIKNLPSYVLDPRLEGTILGQIFLSADVRLKRLVEEILTNSDLQEYISTDSSEPAFRFWIQPKSVRIVESKDKGSAIIESMRLGVFCEFQKELGLKEIFEQEVIPVLERVVNSGKVFRDLRQAIRALLLADWYKKRGGVVSSLDELKDTRYTKPFLSQNLWITRDYMDKYVGEYWSTKDSTVGGIVPNPLSKTISPTDKRGWHGDALGVALKGLDPVAKGEITSIIERWKRSFSSISIKPLSPYQVQEEVQDLILEFIQDLSKRSPLVGQRILKELSLSPSLWPKRLLEKELSFEELVEFWATALTKSIALANREMDKSMWRAIGLLLENLSQQFSTPQERYMFKIDVLKRILKDPRSSLRKDLLEAQKEILSDLERALKVSMENEEKAKEILLNEKNVFSEIGFDGKNFRLGWARSLSETAIREFAEDMSKIFDGKKTVIFVGMGGSINTVKLLVSAFGITNALFFDVPDEEVIEKELKEKNINLEDTSVVLISKSGTTYETKAIAKILKDLVHKAHGKKAEKIIRSNFVWLVDKGNEGRVVEEPIDEEIKKIPLQPNELTDIGGRYSSPWTGVFLAPMLWIYKVSANGNMVIGKKGFIEAMERMATEWKKIMLDPQNPINQDAFLTALVLFNKTMMEGTGPYITVPFTLLPKQDLIEAFRIWVTQLWQESIGGKQKGIHPKVEVSDSSVSSHERLLSLMEKGFVEVDNLPAIKEGKDLYLQIAYMYLLTTYFSALSQIRFLSQDNVQLYKKNLKEISKVKRPPILSLGSLQTALNFIPNLDAKDFVDVVLYGPFTRQEKETIRMVLEKVFPDKIFFIYEGPDYNHHSFEALATDPNTIPVLLVHPKAGQDVIKVAQATAQVFGKKAVYGEIDLSLKPHKTLSDLLTSIVKAIENSEGKIDEKDLLKKISEQAKSVFEGIEHTLVRDELFRIAELELELLTRRKGKFLSQLGSLSVYANEDDERIIITLGKSVPPTEVSRDEVRKLYIFSTLMESLASASEKEIDIDGLLETLYSEGLLDDVPGEKIETLSSMLKAIFPVGRINIDEALFAVNMLITGLNYAPSDTLQRNVFRLFLFARGFSLLTGKTVFMRFQYERISQSDWEENQFLVDTIIAIPSNPENKIATTTELSHSAKTILKKVTRHIFASLGKEPGGEGNRRKKSKTPGGIWVREDVIKFVLGR